MKARIAAQQATECDEKLFKEAPETLGNVPDDFTLRYLKTRLGLGDVLMGKMKAWDPHSLRHILYALTHCLPSLKLGEACRDKLVLTTALDGRVAQIPDALPKLVPGTNINTTTGEIDFAKVGMYQMEFHGTKALRALHRPSGDFGNIDDDLCVTSDWDIKDNWSSLKAALVKGKRKYPIKDLFDEGLGPNRVQTLCGHRDVWRRLLVSAVATCNEQRAAWSEGSLHEIESEEFNQAKKQKAQDAASKARATLLAKRQEREAKRRVSLKGPAAVEKKED